MKKIEFGLIMLFALLSNNNLNAQDSMSKLRNVQDPVAKNVHDRAGKVKYWYYPKSNMYFNESSGDYWYYDEPTTKWMDVKSLPSTYEVTDNTPRYEVWYNGSDVWKDNAMHVKKYKMKKDGRMKTKERKMKKDM